LPPSKQERRQERGQQPISGAEVPIGGEFFATQTRFFLPAKEAYEH